MTYPFMIGSRGRLLCLWAVLSLMPVGLAAAQGNSGFLAGEGRHYWGLSYGRDTVDEYRLGDEGTQLDGKIVRQSLSLWGTYGMTDDLDVWAGLRYSANDAAAALNLADEEGFQDLTAGLRWRFYSEPLGPGKLSLLLAPGVKTPVGDYDSNSIVAIGDGQTDFLGRIVAQYRFDTGSFVSLETGYDLRLGSPGDEWPLHFTVGHTFAERLTVVPYYTRVESLSGATLTSIVTHGSGSGPGATTTVSIAAAEEDYEALGVGAYLRITDRFGLTAGYQSTIDGSNTGIGDGFMVGFVFGSI